MTWFTQFVITLIALIMPSCYGDTFCSTAFQCANQTTSETQRLLNYGYKSHSGSQSSLAANEDIMCAGASSCAQAMSISAVQVSCQASLSCFKVSDLRIEQTYMKTISGSGANAMSHSTIYAASHHIYCEGEQSCSYSLINEFGLIRAEGAYSLLHATIDPTNKQISHAIELYGYYAGFGATITCGKQHTCSIVCHATGCTNLFLTCDDNCDITGISNHTIASIHNVWKYDSFHLVQQLDDTCSAQIDSMNFDSSAERSHVSDVLDNADGGPICCRGYRSCVYNRIQYTSSINESLVCSARESCIWSHLYNNGPVFCSGMNACVSSSIVATAMYCQAYWSCKLTVMSGATDIYCSGYRSCQDAVISSTGFDFNLYLTGSFSGRSANVTCSEFDHCSIFCYGYKGCDNMNLECIGTCTVHCDVDSMCPKVFNTTSTLLPTGNPSVLPTSTSSINPSRFPSIIPSVHPSSNMQNTMTIAPTVASSHLNTTDIPNDYPLTVHPSEDTKTSHLGTTDASNAYDISSTELSSKDGSSESDIDTLVLRILISVLLFVVLLIIVAMVHQCCLKKHDKAIESVDSLSLDIMKPGASVMRVHDNVTENKKHVEMEEQATEEGTEVTKEEMNSHEQGMDVEYGNDLVEFDAIQSVVAVDKVMSEEPPTVMTKRNDDYSTTGGVNIANIGEDEFVVQGEDENYDTVQ
eukprot:941310_1